MKKLLFILTLLIIAVYSWGQDTAPTGDPNFKHLKAPNNPAFWYFQSDSSVWIYKGTYGWTKLGKYSDLKLSDWNRAFDHSQNDMDTIIGNEYNTSAHFDKTTNIFYVVDPGGSVSDTIELDPEDINNLPAYINANETDPVFSAWDKSTGILIDHTQITDWATATAAFLTGESDPVFTAWDKSTGIVIDHTQISDWATATAAFLTGEVDGSVTNELITNVTYLNDTLTIYEGGNVWKAAIISGSGGGGTSAGIVNTIPVTASHVNVVFPRNMSTINYFVWVRAYYDKAISATDTIEVVNGIKNFTKTLSGFSLDVKTTGGYLQYFAMDTTDWTNFTFDNYISEETDPVWTTDQPNYYTQSQVNALPVSTFTNDAGYISALSFPSAGIVTSTGTGFGTSISNTTVGTNFLTATNPNAISYPQVSSTNTVSFLSGSSLRSAIGAGTMSNFYFCQEGEFGGSGYNVSGGGAIGVFGAEGVKAVRTNWWITNSLDFSTLSNGTSFNAAPYFPYYDAVNGTKKIALSNVDLSYFSSGSTSSGYAPISDGSGGITWSPVSGGGATNLGYISSATTGTVTSDTGTDATIPAATTSVAGLLTATDKTKLNGIATGSDYYGSWAVFLNGSYQAGINSLDKVDFYAGTNISLAWDDINQRLTINSTASGSGFWTRDATNGSIYPSTTTDHVTIGTSSYSSAELLHVTGTSTENGIYGSSGVNSGYGIYGYGVNGATGIKGYSSNSFGVYGSSGSSFGVYGYSTGSYGVNGQSNTSTGTYGSSVSGIGVRGQSSSSIGVSGTGQTGVSGGSTLTDGYGGYFTSTGSGGIGAYVSGNKSAFQVTLNTAPTSSSAAGTQGEIRFDANYMYICTVTGNPGTWKRVAFSTW